MYCERILPMSDHRRYLGALGAAAGLILLLAVATRTATESTSSPPPPAEPGPVTSTGRPATPHGGYPPITPGCPTTPLLWRLVDVDPRFELSTEAIRAAVERAGGIWEQATGRDLFLETHGGVGSNLPEALSSIPGQGIPQEAMTIRFVFDERQERARERQATKGGPEDPVEVEAAAYRTLVAQGPGGGVMVRREIRVFRFRDGDDLVRVLAHELGHALGLPHVDAQGFIMSAYYGPGEGAPAVHPASRARLEACVPGLSGSGLLERPAPVR